MLNLPFTEDYIASLRRFQKIQLDNRLASELVQYVDDARIVACSTEQAWLASSQIAKGLCFFGLQDTSRKRRRCSCCPGAWAGCVLSTDSTKCVTKFVTKKRWEKMKLKIRWIVKQLDYVDEYALESFDNIDSMFDSPSNEKIHFKTTEKLVGSIVYVCQTYKHLKTYLKGIYLTLKSWRSGRDPEGWITEEARIVARKGKNDKDKKKNRLKWIDVVPCLHLDIKALMILSAYKNPPELPLRVFIIGDSSGPGFGLVFWRQGKTFLNAEVRLWIQEIIEENSSNFREAYNLVTRVKRLFLDG